ncbi:MAG TPA: hypothetical protein VMQ67_11325, partial [Candidatus Saccharimonadales bacterium]|nr:hypothetical protein [Candidatus Saccharimonadales bacterium]
MGAGVAVAGGGCDCCVVTITILLGADDGLSAADSVSVIVRVILLVPDMTISILRGGGLGSAGAALVGGTAASAIATAGGVLVSGGGRATAVCGTV